MKLNKLFLALLALPLALVACNKSESPKAESEYLFDLNLKSAERILAIEDEGITFEENQFMIALEDESHMLSLLIQGEQSETTLNAGTYTSQRGALVLDSCVLMTEDETLYTFAGGEGSVTVALQDSVYTIDAQITDANGSKYRFHYEGKIANMGIDDRYFKHDYMSAAERLLPEDINEIAAGDIGIMFVSESSLYVLTVVFTLEEGEDVLTAGTYSSDKGTFKVKEGFYSNLSASDVVRFESGEAKVEGDYNGYNIEIVQVDAEGRTFHFTYEGTIKRMKRTFEDAEAYARCLGYYEGSTYNFMLWLGENIGDEYENSPIKQRFVIDLYSAKVEKDADGYYKLPNGTYTLDKKNSCDEWTMVQGGTYYECGASEIEFMDATLVVTDEGVTFTATEIMANGTPGALFKVVTNGEVKAVEDSKFVAEPQN